MQIHGNNVFDHQSNLQLTKCPLIPIKRLETTHGLEERVCRSLTPDQTISLLPAPLVFKFNPVPRLHPLCRPPTPLVSLALLGVKTTVVTSFQFADWWGNKRRYACIYAEGRIGVRMTASLFRQKDQSQGHWCSWIASGPYTSSFLFISL